MLWNTFADSYDDSAKRVHASELTDDDLSPIPNRLQSCFPAFSRKYLAGCGITRSHRDVECSLRKRTPLSVLDIFIRYSFLFIGYVVLVS